MATIPPLIITLALDEASFSTVNAMRNQYFPAHLNFIPAHVTLFHNLPNTPSSLSMLKAVVPNQHTFPLLATGVIFLGRGVAIRLESAALQVLHHRLKTAFINDLIPQDTQPFRPHITIQNKVASADARQLFHELQTSFEKFEMTALGLNIIEYHGGPWRKVETVWFA